MRAPSQEMGVGPNVGSPPAKDIAFLPTIASLNTARKWTQGTADLQDSGPRHQRPGQKNHAPAKYQ